MQADGIGRHVFTMKVDSLDPNALPANAIWKTYFNLGTTKYYVEAFNDAAAGTSFNHGTQDANNIDTPGGSADSGSFNADGTIVITVSNNKIGSPPVGTSLTSVNGATQILVGVGPVGGSLQSVDTTSSGSYTVVGNAACGSQTPTPTPTPISSANAPKYTIYAPPSGIGAGAGEPSIGINWKTGKVFFVAGTQTLRVTFEDCVFPATALWENVTSPQTLPTTLDPILFTDPQTGRTFVSQLLGKTSQIVYTDNDAGVDGRAPGDWLVSQGSGINSGVDHQTVGGGPLAAPLTRDPADTTVYPNAVYYASQDAAVAQAAISLDGGTTFGPAVPMYNLTQCDGIHGHVKVGPDGTAYVPNKACGSAQAVIVSENNGISWEVRPVQGSTAASGIIDPSVGVSTNGTVYFGYVNGSGLPFAAVSPHTDPTKSRGKGWIRNQRIGAELGIVNATFAQMIAGDDDRAAFAFLGSTTPGDHQAPITSPGGFKGEWHLYIATTYDGGLTWTTVDATPNDPVQRNSICNSGTVVCDREPNDRNLLDFNDVQVDKQGRVLAAFADGCITQACIQGLDVNNDGFKDNDYSARATIARQSGGRGLFAAFDPGQPTVPSTPSVTATRDAAGVHLDWVAPPNGGSPITGYNVYRRADGNGSPSLIATTTNTNYDDTTADPAVTYFYHVRAVNAVGESAFCPGNEIAPSPVPDPCNLPGVRVATDTTDSGQNTPPVPAVDIQSLSVAEPYFGPGVNRLVFTLKVGPAASAPPNSQWYVIWNRPVPDANFDRNYVAMKTDATGAPAFEYGRISPPSVNLPTRIGAADNGTYDAATGTITITIANSKIDNIGAGQALIALDARTFLSRADGQPVTGLSASDVSPAGQYELRGNAFCTPNAAPVAVLAANPTAGAAPLVVVFDGSGSSDSDPGDSIVSYEFNFGDGTPVVSQTTPNASHTYTTAGAYRATLTVRDTDGTANINAAEKLITVEGSDCLTNVASALNGASATASSTYSGGNGAFPVSAAINGDRTGANWGNGGGWNDATRGVYPDSLEVAFSSAKTISEIRVFSLQNNYPNPVEPTPELIGDYYGLQDFDVQYWDGSQWVNVPGGQIVNNDRVMRTLTFAPITTGRIRVVVNNARNNYSRIIEVEAFGCSTQ